MDLIKSVILGIIQGVAEFLPISSSGHLVIAQQLFGLSYNEAENLIFDVFLHFGTLVAVIIVFRKTVWGLIKAFFSLVKKLFTGKFKYSGFDRYEKLFCLLVLSIIPLFPVLLVKDFIEGFFFTNTVAVGIALMFTAVMLFFCDRFASGKINAENAKLKHPIIVGIFQAVGTVPGISRSGATITGGLLCGFEKQFAIEFAFVMSIPAVFGANVLSLFKVIKNGMDTPVYYCIIGALVACVTGIASIKLVELIAKKNKFIVFSAYCLAAGVVTVILSLIR